MSRRRVSFDDRRIAEAVRFLERDGADPMAASSVAVREDDFEAAVTARARTVPVADDLAIALGQVDHALRWVAAGLLLAALVVGGATAAAALGSAPVAEGTGRTLNLIELLLAVLGVQTLFLLAWLLLTIGRPRLRATSPLLWLPQAMLRRLARAGLRRPEALDGRSRLAAAARATAEPLAAPGVGRATAALLTHGTWTAFNVGAMLILVVLMSSREYRFTWETTLLDAETGERIVRSLLVPPDALGVPAPDEAAIERARPGAAATQADADRRAWAIATLGAVALYGLLPRMLLLAGSAALWRRRRRRWRLDLEHPGYQRLRPLLAPSSPAVIEEPDDPRPPVPPAADGDETDEEEDEAASGDPVLLRLETERPAAWPPPLSGIAWRDLDLVDGRADEHRVTEEVAAMAPAPVRVFAVVHLSITPDRGHERFLAAVRDAGGRRLRLVLTGGQSLRRRSGAAAVTARVDAWQALGRRLGLRPSQVLELDLDHVTERSLDRLDAMLGAGRATSQDEAAGATGGHVDGAAPPAWGSHLDSALELVVDAASQWRTAPDAAVQAELHRAIQRRYRAEPARVAGLLGVGLGERATGGTREALRRLHDADAESLSASMRSAAAGVLDRLPPGLRASPRWAAAGAVAGACGCLAAAAAISPLAVTALPAWAGGGAVIAAVLRSVRREARGEAVDSGEADPAAEPARIAAETGAAVDAAILLVLLLELQGRDEDVISRVLERTLSPAGAAGGAVAGGGVAGGAAAAGTPMLRPGDEAALRRLADDVRERFDDAMSAEVAR